MLDAPHHHDNTFAIVERRDSHSSLSQLPESCISFCCGTVVKQLISQCDLRGAMININWY